MKRTTAIRPALEVLEDRCCPSVSALLDHGSLKVNADQSVNLAMTETPAGMFVVSNNGNSLGTFAVTDAIRVDLSKAANSVAFNFDGQAAPGDVVVSMPATSGNNQVTVENGTIKGNLKVYGGQDNDTVILGDAAGTPVQVNGETYIQLNAGASDALRVNSGATLKGDLTATSANDLTLAAGSTVKGSALINGGPAGNGVELDGYVGRLARFTGSMLNGDHVTVGHTADLGSLVVLFGDGKSSLNMDGTVRDKFFMQTGAGDDTIDIEGSIGALARMHLGNGNDTVTIGANIGASGSGTTLDVDTGAGNDTVKFADSLDVHGHAEVCLGAGNDTFILGDASVFGSATINGGKGDNTFIGDPGRVTSHGFGH